MRRTAVLITACLAAGTVLAAGGPVLWRVLGPAQRQTPPDHHVSVADDWGPPVADHPGAGRDHVIGHGWAPCDPAARAGPAACADPATDICDAAYAAARSGGAARVIALMIDHRATVDERRLTDCPQYRPLWQRAAGGFADGTHLVGRDLRPGTYRAVAAVGASGCTWERRHAGTVLPGHAAPGTRPSLTVAPGDVLVSIGCGAFEPLA